MMQRLRVLFLIACLGVFVVLCLAADLAAALLGPIAFPVVLLPVGAGVVALVRKARALNTPRLPEGRTCTCCTSTVHDPVEVR